jgi:pimeloyl-ACP methyl ester carboxylesterase
MSGGPDWGPDVLGDGYEATTLALVPDGEGEVVATLVRRRCDPPASRAVLYVHGYVDYFFQTHLADHYLARGWDFYALDLRKYGRSLRPHQTTYFTTSMEAYQEELDAAVEIVREVDGHDRLLAAALDRLPGAGAVGAPAPGPRPGRRAGVQQPVPRVVRAPGGAGHVGT